MKNIQTRVDESIDEFIGRLKRAVGEYAAEMIEQRLAKRDTPRQKARSQVARRSPDQMSALCDGLFKQISHQPGETMMVLSQAMGHSSAALALPARKLLAAGKVRKTGQNEMTRYFPVGRPPCQSGHKRYVGHQTKLQRFATDYTNR